MKKAERAKLLPSLLFCRRNIILYSQNNGMLFSRKPSFSLFFRVLSLFAFLRRLFVCVSHSLLRGAFASHQNRRFIVLDLISYYYFSMSERSFRMYSLMFSLFLFALLFFLILHILSFCIFQLLLHITFCSLFH